MKNITFYLNHRLLVILLLSFASGLPLSLTTNTLQAWYTQAGVDIITISFLALAGIPYILKFLWAPLLDRYIPPFLGRRRGWMLITQIAIIVTLIAMAFSDPQFSPQLLGCLALLVAFFSATQDIASDAYRTDILKPEERGLGAAFMVAAYRLAMLISGGIALIFADYLGWCTTYILMASLMMIGVFAVFWGKEPLILAKPPTSLKNAIVEPFREFLSRKYAILLLSLVILYKLGDAFALTLSTPFLLRGLSFSLTEVGILIKGVGTTGILLGVFIGGLVMTKIGQFRALFLFGVLQACSNLVFMLLAWIGNNYALAAVAIFFENIAAGMGTAAFIAFLMGLCDHRYTAFQFALLSALAAIGRVVIGPVSGLLVVSLGWANFFFWAFLMTLPSLFLLWWLRHHVEMMPAKVEVYDS